MKPNATFTVTLLFTFHAQRDERSGLRRSGRVAPMRRLRVPSDGGK